MVGIGGLVKFSLMTSGTGIWGIGISVRVTLCACSRYVSSGECKNSVMIEGGRRP